MSKNLKAHLALFSVNLIYALSFGFSKDVMDGYLPAFTFILFRVLAATALFWLLFFKTEKIEAKDYFKFAIACQEIIFHHGWYKLSKCKKPKR